MQRTSLCRRVTHLEQQRHASTRRIFIYYEDSRQAGESAAEAMARQGIAPAPQDIVLRVQYEATRPDILSPPNAAGWPAGAHARQSSPGGLDRCGGARRPPHAARRQRHGVV